MVMENDFYTGGHYPYQRKVMRDSSVAELGPKSQGGEALVTACKYIMHVHNTRNTQDKRIIVLQHSADGFQGKQVLILALISGVMQ